MAGKTWQHLNGDNWVFGKSVRGVVRDIEAEVDSEGYEDAEPESDWKYYVWQIKSGKHGTANNLGEAIKAAERAMNVTNGN